MSGPDKPDKPDKHLPLFPDPESQPISPVVPPLVEVKFEKSWSLKKRFEVFHEHNPEVYRNLRDVALDMRRRGLKRWAIASIFERLRWLYKFQTKGDDYKLNNSWRAFYARELMERESELAGFFEIRVQHSGD